MTVSFDPAYNLKTLLDGRGLTTTYTLANLASEDSSVLGKSYSDGSGGVNYAYDEYGRVTSVTNHETTQTFTYDDLDNLLDEAVTFTGLPGKTYSVSNSFDTDGARESMTVTVNGVASPTDYTYDSGGRLTLVSYPWGDTQTSVYYQNNWLRQHYNRITKTAYTYNQRGWLATVGNSNLTFSAPLSNFDQIAYDAAGNRVFQRDNVPSIDYPFGATDPITSSAGYTGNVTYTYDALDHLQEEHNACVSYANEDAGGGSNVFPALPYDNLFASDGADNLTTVRGALTPVNDDNQLTANTYDGDGNPTTYHGSALTFDIEDRLTATSFHSAGYYDDGTRAWKQVGSTRTYFLYDGGHLVAEIQGSDGSLLNLFGWGTAGLDERYETGGSPYYSYTFDPSGNLVTRSDSKPFTACDYTALYDAFGAQLGEISPLTQTQQVNQDRVGYGGQWGYYTDQESVSNPTNPAVRYLWVRCGVRDYDSATARWLERDPIGYEGGINVYSFCDNNPVTGVDPSGEDALIFWGRNQHGRDRSQWGYFYWLAKRYAEAYEQNSGNEISGSTDDVLSQKSIAHIIKAESFSDIQNALKNAQYPIDTIIYVGHAGPEALYLSDKELKVSDVERLDTQSVIPNARISLYGCDTAASITPDGGINIAQGFANHFGTLVEGSDGGLSFGAPFAGTDWWPGYLRSDHGMRVVKPGGHAGSWSRRRRLRQRSHLP